MTRQEKQMLKSVRISYGYGARKSRMKKVYRKLYPRIRARKRVQLIELASVLRQMDKSLSYGLRYASTPQNLPVTIYDSVQRGFMRGDLEAIGGPWHETH